MEKEVEGMVLDDNEIFAEEPMQVVEKPEPRKPRVTRRKQTIEPETEQVSCLRNERIIIRFVPKQSGIVSDPKHILYGGMAENAVRWFTAPKMESGLYYNVLTDSEKAFLEEIMGLEYNALSIYKKVDNYWDNLMVRLTKQDNYLNLADPEDYIKYKVLLANKDLIAPSVEALQVNPKATYQFVIIQEGEESKMAKKEMNATMESYMLFGKIQDDVDTLRVIIETIDGRPTAKTSKLEFLQSKVNKLIQANAKLFLRVAGDPLLSTKVLIKNAIEANLISNRGGMLYLRSDGSPLCGDNEEPTLNIAAKYLNMPKHQDLKFSLEAQLK